MSFPSVWFQGLDKKEKEEFEYALRHSLVLERLVEILEQKVTSVEKTSKEDYKNPAWPYFRADKDGQIRAYKEVLSLFDKKEKS